MFTTTEPIVQIQRLQLLDRVEGLLHRHLLQQRDQVHRGLRGTAGAS